MPLRAVLKLEFIGENIWAYQRAAKRYGAFVASLDREEFRSGPAHHARPWVARITGRDERHGLAREFIDGQIDYSDANGTGSRGVFLYFMLTPGVYEVYARETWTRTRRYFIRVTHDMTLVEMSEEEVLACLRSGDWA